MANSKKRRRASRKGQREPRVTNKEKTHFDPPSTERILEVIAEREERRLRPNIPWAGDE